MRNTSYIYIAQQTCCRSSQFCCWPNHRINVLLSHFALYVYDFWRKISWIVLERWFMFWCLFDLFHFELLFSFVFSAFFEMIKKNVYNRASQRKLIEYFPQFKCFYAFTCCNVWLHTIYRCILIQRVDCASVVERAMFMLILISSGLRLLICQSNRFVVAVRMGWEKGFVGCDDGNVVIWLMFAPKCFNIS